MMVYIWLGILVLMVIIEVITTQMVTIWFALGALAAFVAALAGVEQLWIQIVIFVVVSAVALVATRPLVKKFINKKTVPTNADMVIGKTAVVTETIDNIRETGLVKVAGSVWSAKSVDDTQIEEGQLVIVKEIKGVKLFVKISE